MIDSPYCDAATRSRSLHLAEPPTAAPRVAESNQIAAAGEREASASGASTSQAGRLDRQRRWPHREDHRQGDCQRGRSQITGPFTDPSARVIRASICPQSRSQCKGVPVLAGKLLRMKLASARVLPGSPRRGFVRARRCASGSGSCLLDSWPDSMVMATMDHAGRGACGHIQGVAMVTQSSEGTA